MQQTPKVIEICGTQCSGKTYTLEPFKDNPDIAIFDILDFYTSHKIIVNDQMDWDKWRERSPLIPIKLKEFIKDNHNKKVIIVEHCFNKIIEEILAEYNSVQLVLVTPTPDVIEKRAKERNLNVARVIDFRYAFITKNRHKQTHSMEAIRDFIRCYL